MGKFWLPQSQTEKQRRVEDLRTVATSQNGPWPLQPLMLPLRNLGWKAVGEGRRPSLLDQSFPTGERTQGGRWPGRKMGDKYLKFLILPTQRKMKPKIRPSFSCSETKGNDS